MKEDTKHQCNKSMEDMQQRDRERILRKTANSDSSSDDDTQLTLCRTTDYKLL